VAHRLADAITVALLAAARDYNVQLAQRRAQTVAGLLAAAGIDRGLVTVDGRGDSEQAVDCRQRFKSSRELQECLGENRRVQIDVRGTRQVP
jgi:outer membrane protein OmpA-like peptidoglycan-associated protein